MFVWQISLHRSSPYLRDPGPVSAAGPGLWPVVSVGSLIFFYAVQSRVLTTVSTGCYDCGVREYGGIMVYTGWLATATEQLRHLRLLRLLGLCMLCTLDDGWRIPTPMDPVHLRRGDTSGRTACSLSAAMRSPPPTSATRAGTVFTQERHCAACAIVSLRELLLAQVRLL